MSLLKIAGKGKSAQLSAAAAPWSQQEQEQEKEHENKEQEQGQGHEEKEQEQEQGQEQKQEEKEQSVYNQIQMRRRDDDEDVYGRRIISVDLPSPSTKEAGRVARNSSRPLSVRPLRLPQSKSTTSLLLLLIAAILTALSLRSGNGISSIGVQAETCSPNGIQNVTVSDDMASNNLSDVFACDDGEFNVSWVGVVYVSKTIKIGPGTIVRIFGETAMVTTGTESSSDPVSSSLKSRNSEKNSSDIDLEFELERLSNGLNLPQGLTSAAVASVGLGGGDSSSDFFGPIFFVEQGELHLDSLAVRRGNSSNSSSNVIVSGGGILAINSNVSVSGCVFEENFAQILGGGIHANLSTLVVKDSVFHRNHAGLQSFAGDEDAGSAGGGIAVSTLLAPSSFVYISF